MTRLYIALVLAVAFALVGLGYRWGVDSEQGKKQQDIVERLNQAFEQGREFGTVRDRIVTEYVDRVQFVEKRGATMIKEVPVYVSAKADAACAVNAGFVRLHDAAATGADLSTAGHASAANDAPSGIALSAVAETTVANYTACHANAEKLSSLQALVRDFQDRQQGKAPP